MDDNIQTKISPQEEAFEKRRKSIGLFLGPALGLLVYFMPMPGVAWNAHALAAIMVFVCTWWITEAFPIPVTSLAGPVLASVFGVVSAKEAFGPFGEPIMFLFVGSFVLAKAMAVHGLDKRFAYSILSLKCVGSSPARILLAIGAATALLSGWVSNTATAAMMLPIALGLLYAIRDMCAANGKEIDLKSYPYATGIMLMVAYAAAIGGNLTPVGAPGNMIALGFLDKLAHVKVSFFQWMVWGSIISVLYFTLTYIILKRMFPAGIERIEGAEAFIKAKLDSLGSWSRGEKNALFAFGIAITLWITPGIISIVAGSNSPALKLFKANLTEPMVAMVAALLLFIMPVNWKEREFTISWKQADSGIEWGTLMLFGSGLSLGAMMYKTGLSQIIGDGIVAATGAHTLTAMVILFSILSLVMSELTSHTAATNMVMPLGITAALAAGVDPIPVTVGMALASSLGFVMPVSQPPNAIVYSTGLVPITSMMKSGIIIDIIGMIFITIPVVLLLVERVMK